MLNHLGAEASWRPFLSVTLASAAGTAAASVDTWLPGPFLLAAVLLLPTGASRVPRTLLGLSLRWRRCAWRMAGADRHSRRHCRGSHTARTRRGLNNSAAGSWTSFRAMKRRTRKWAPSWRGAEGPPSGGRASGTVAARGLRCLKQTYLKVKRSTSVTWMNNISITDESFYHWSTFLWRLWDLLHTLLKVLNISKRKY